jgi:hypothetical protein
MAQWVKLEAVDHLVLLEARGLAALLVRLELAEAQDLLEQVGRLVLLEHLEGQAGLEELAALGE